MISGPGDMNFCGSRGLIDSIVAKSKSIYHLGLIFVCTGTDAGNTQMEIIASRSTLYLGNFDK